MTSDAINKFERKTSKKEAARARKGLSLFISNEDMSDIIKIIKALEYLNVLIDGITETEKHEIKNKKVDFFLIC